MRRPDDLDYSWLFREMQTCGFHIYRRQILQRREVCHHLAIITAQKLIARSYHVNIVRLSLGTLLVHELEHWFVCRSTLQMYFHNVEQRSAQIRRAMLGGSIAARAVIARFTRRRVNACKGNQRLFALKAAHIPDLRHELRPEGFTNTVHFHDDRVFGQLRYQLVHLAAIRFSTARDCCELVCSFLNERFRDRGFLHQYNSRLYQSIYLGSFLCAELVTVALAPLAVTLSKVFRLPLRT